MTYRIVRRRAVLASFPLLLSPLLLLPPSALADNCLSDASYNGDAPGRIIFPNWNMVYQGSFGVQLTLNGFGPATIAGITIANFGTANGISDIGAVYARFSCVLTGPDADTGLLTLTYAGVYNEDSGPLPVWTWGGASAVDFSGCPDACGTTFPCGAGFTMYLYADVKACPTAGTSVNLGFPSNSVLNPGMPGSLYDGQGFCAIPWAIGDITRGADEDTIALAYKDGPLTAAPGDTISYTIFYGRPGTASLSSIVVTDTLPSFTHYLIGTAVPAPDPLWDPDPGPPTRMRWTIPGPLAVTGGISGQITFQITVDWGNGEIFEPGSGDIGAPEGQPLINSAHIDFQGTTCAQKSATTTPTRTVVRRFLFWKLGDNDVLYAPSLGQPPDEMTYSIFLKNLSSTKTWWDVKVWDTVPAQLDSWGPGFGFDDPCQGWTMSPSGCSAAAPGVVVSGTKTILTWKLDMPPGMTLTVNWRAQVRGNVTVGQTAINQIMIKGAGRTGIVNGTGDTGAPRVFTHAASIILRTTYVSYVGYAANINNSKTSCPGFFISFFPLNKQTQFELRGIQYQGGAQWSGLGGVSDSIGCYLGDCVSGFPGSASCTLGTGAISGGGYAGCKVERIPATYDPVGWLNATCPTLPYNFIYKITSNAPVTWQLLTHMANCNQDRHTYAPASNLTYAGFMLYTWRGDYADGSSLGLINTGIDVNGGFNATTGTTAHLFRFNYGSLQWDYQKSFDIAGESQVSDWSVCPNNTQPCPDTAPWRVMSSDTKLVMHVGEYAYNTSGCCCCSGADNHGAFAPMRETGYAVGAGNFYGICGPNGCGANQGLVLVGSTNAAATYNVWIYTPDTNIGSAKIAALLRGTSGSWTLKATASIPAVNSVPPPNNAFDVWVSVPFKRGGSNLFKIETVSGGPIQVLHGTDMFGQWSGGAPIHAFDGKPSGSTFWHHQTRGRNACGTLVVQLFTPKTGVVIRAVSNDGYSARYTTTGTDQCISFMYLTCLPAGVLRSTRFDVLTAGQAAMCQYQQEQNTEKGFTAPFLASGTHYTIIAPPVVFTGQTFWLTVIVESGLGGIDTSYTGTASFTSTDPVGKIENTGMDTYNYTFTLADAGDRMFINVTFTKLGLQTFVAADTLDGSITGLAAIMVVGADVKLTKLPRISVQASGDTVRFQICWSNYSSTSAFTFVITDAVPMGTTFVPEATTVPFTCGSTDGVTVTTAYSIATTAAAPPTASFVTGLPTAPTRWLRFTVPMAGVQTTGCACFRVSVN